MQVNDKTFKINFVAFLEELCKYLANVGAIMNKNLNLNDWKLTTHAKRCKQFFMR